MRIGLAVYGTTFSMGLHPASGRPALRPQQVMEQALTAGLSGVELPLSLWMVRMSQQWLAMLANMVSS